MKSLLTATAASILVSAVPVLAQPFKPFSVLFNSYPGECQVTLAFPEANFCGTKLKPEQVIGWYSGRRQDKGSGFFIYTKEEMLQVRFIDPGANQRFNVELQIWSRQKPTIPIDDYASNVYLGN